jgi:hypothetical protein
VGKSAGQKRFPTKPKGKDYQIFFGQASGIGEKMQNFCIFQQKHANRGLSIFRKK